MNFSQVVLNKEKSGSVPNFYIKPQRAQGTRRKKAKGERLKEKGERKKGFEEMVDEGWFFISHRRTQTHTDERNSYTIKRFMAAFGWVKFIKRPTLKSAAFR